MIQMFVTTIFCNLAVVVIT